MDLSLRAASALAEQSRPLLRRTIVIAVQYDKHTAGMTSDSGRQLNRAFKPPCFDEAVLRDTNGAKNLDDVERTLPFCDAANHNRDRLNLPVTLYDAAEANTHQGPCGVSSGGCSGSGTS